MQSKEIKIPTSWSDITLKQFDQIVSLSRDSSLMLTERELQIISILAEIPIDEVKALDSVSFQSISNALLFLNSTPPKVFPKERLILNGTKYHADLFVNHISAAQFLDYKVIGSSENLDKRTARLLACFIYPENSSYNDSSYNIEDVVNDINDYMTVPEVTSYSNFFTIQYVTYATSLLAYLENQVKTLKGISEQEKKETLKKLASVKASIKSFGTLE